MKNMKSFFKGQLSSVIEWKEFRDDMLFWKWNESEVKKGSRLILRPSQHAIFLQSGKIEGIFTESGNYDVESDIIPFLSTLKGFRFGFNTGMRAEVLFVNTKLFQVKWGTKSPIYLNVPQLQLPGGVPIRANGTYSFKIDDYIGLIENIAGIKESYVVEDVKSIVSANLNALLMKWIQKEGKDMFNLQANALEISRGLTEDFDMNVISKGIKITEFNIASISYPDEIKAKITEMASQGMIGNEDRYDRIRMTDAVTDAIRNGGGNSGGSGMGGTANEIAGMMMGMNMAGHMMKGMNQQMNPNYQQPQQPQPYPNQYQQPQQSQPYPNQYQQPQQSQPYPNQHQQPQQPQAQPHSQQGEASGNQGSASSSSIPNFCPNCGAKTSGMNFCGNCGHKLA